MVYGSNSPLILPKILPSEMGILAVFFRNLLLFNNLQAQQNTKIGLRNAASGKDREPNLELLIVKNGTFRFWYLLSLHSPQ